MRPVHVTTIIRAAGCLPAGYARASPAQREEALRRGKAVHRMCQLEAQGRLDEGSVDPSLLGYRTAWRSFRRATELNGAIEWIAWELRLQAGSVTGRLDLVFRHRGLRVIADVKTGRSMAEFASMMQVGKYGALWNRTYPEEPVRQGCVILLRPNGTFKPAFFDRHSMEDAAQWFQAAELLYYLRRQNGCLRAGEEEERDDDDDGDFITDEDDDDASDVNVPA